MRQVCLTSDWEVWIRPGFRQSSDCHAGQQQQVQSNAKQGRESSGQDNKVHSQAKGTAAMGLQTDPPPVLVGLWPQAELKWGSWVNSRTGGGRTGGCSGPGSPPQHPQGSDSYQGLSRSYSPKVPQTIMVIVVMLLFASCSPEQIILFNLDTHTQV